MAAEGETRFEDRYRLPIGISVNMTSFSAKLLTSTLYNPRNVLVFAQVLSLEPYKSEPLQCFGPILPTHVLGRLSGE